MQEHDHIQSMIMNTEGNSGGCNPGVPLLHIDQSSRKYNSSKQTEYKQLAAALFPSKFICLCLTNESITQ